MLKSNMSLHDIHESIHKLFYFEKSSKAGNLYKISEQVVHTPMMDNNIENKEEANAQYKNSGSYSANMDNTKEIKIYGCNHAMNKSEITN